MDAPLIVRTTVPACMSFVPYWHIDTPPGTAVEIRVRAAAGSGAPSDWLRLARWGAQSTTLPPAAVRGLARAVDTLTADPEVLGGPVTSVEFEIRPVPAPEAPAGSANGPAPEAPVGSADVPAPGAPVVHWIRVLARTPARPREAITASAPRGIDVDHRLPAISQHAAGTLEGFAAADAWCAPTSLAMVMAHLDRGLGAGEAHLDRHLGAGEAELAARVRANVRGMWDREYAGAGNWAFAVAWANTCGFDAALAELPDLRAAEDLLAAGEVLIASLSFTREQLPEAGYPTAGHLLVITGVTPAGDVRVHDPGRRVADGVRAVYPREAFEQAWLSAEGSGGLVYRVRSRRTTTSA